MKRAIGLCDRAIAAILWTCGIVGFVIGLPVLLLKTVLVAVDLHLSIRATKAEWRRQTARREGASAAADALRRGGPSSATVRPFPSIPGKGVH